MDQHSLPTTPPQELRSEVRCRLSTQWHRQNEFQAHDDSLQGNSAVMLLLGHNWDGKRFGDDVGIFLNKRSPQVRQPGDICCPGGGLDLHKDRFLARILEIPGVPFGINPWVTTNGGTAAMGMPDVSLALATALREGWEEMRLNPLRFSFLGPLPAECLSLFKRRIFPLVGWSRKQKAFRPNWEVAAVPFVPLRDLLDKDNYVALQMIYPAATQVSRSGYQKVFTGFRFNHGGREEILWGATFRIVSRFLALIFGFQPPPLEALPPRTRVMDEGYMKGG